jgi:hypothetical protein
VSPGSSPQNNHSGICDPHFSCAGVLSGRYDLRIDEINGSLELPATQGRESRRLVLLSKVEGAYVAKIQGPSSDGESQPSFAPTLRIKGTIPETEYLVQWYDEEKAARFVEWLRPKLPQKSAPSRPLGGEILVVTSAGELFLVGTISTASVIFPSGKF